jgi:hypothetical protein
METLPKSEVGARFRKKVGSFFSSQIGDHDDSNLFLTSSPSRPSAIIFQAIRPIASPTMAG